MKVTLVGKNRLNGTSKKTGKPYDFNVAYVTYAEKGIDGLRCDNFMLDPGEYPYETLFTGKTYNVEFNRTGYVIGFEKVV